MKRIITLVLVMLSLSVFAQSMEPIGPAIIRNIDDNETPRNYVMVSEEGLPYDHYLGLLDRMDIFNFTLISEDRAEDLFENLAENSRARMRQPKGACSQRRAYIQNHLKNMNITSGRFLISCPANNGRLRLRDQVSRHYYTYSNYHDTNVIAVSTPTGSEFRVMDVQFEDGPVSLHEYLSEIENFQRIRPLKRKGTSKGLCYWTISTPYLTFKKEF